MLHDLNKLTLEELETEYKKLLEDVAKEEKNMLKKGFKYKLKIYIHHYSGGDDTAEVTYHKTKPTKAYIQKRLKNSCMKNDYCIIKLK